MKFDTYTRVNPFHRLTSPVSDHLPPPAAVHAVRAGDDGLRHKRGVRTQSGPHEHCSVSASSHNATLKSGRWHVRSHLDIKNKSAAGILTRLNHFQKKQRFEWPSAQEVTISLPRTVCEGQCLIPFLTSWKQILILLFNLLVLLLKCSFARRHRP